MASRWLAEGSTPLPDTSLKVAVVAAVSVVLTAVITAIAAAFTTRNRASDTDDTDAQARLFIENLQHQLAVNTARIEHLERSIEQGRTNEDRIQRVLWQAGVDPATGEPVRRRPGG